MTYYAYFNKADAQINFGYDMYLNSNLVIGFSSNLTKDRLLIYNEKTGGRSGLNAAVRVQEMDIEHKNVRMGVAASNLFEMELGIYSFSNGSNAYLKTTGSTSFIIETSGQERMRFLSGGNIGIGTTRPLAPFHLTLPGLFSNSNQEASLTLNNRSVGPALRIIATNTSNSSLWQVQNNSGVTGLDYLNNGNVQFFPTGGTNCLSVGSTRTVSSGTRLDVVGNMMVGGNVGIGTTVSSYSLQVQGDIYASGTLYQSTLNQAIFSQVSSSTAGGGSSTANLYVVRALNTVDYNDITGVSLNTGTGQITIAPGKYHIRIRASAFSCGYHRLRFFNQTTVAPVAYGMAHYVGTNNQNEAFIDFILVTSSTHVYIIQHWTELSVANNGFGVYNALHATNYLGTNSYMVMHIEKLA